MYSNRYFIVFLIAFVGLTSNARSQSKYVLDIDLKIEEETLVVSQTIEYTNTSNDKLSVLYLYDWANSYQGAPAPLANHLANEFNRSFYISSNNKLGFTQIDVLTSVSILNWSRLADQLDIIKVNLNKELAAGESIEIQLEYLIKIPDDKFTGIGINSNKGIILRDLFISMAPRYNEEWLLNSNLGFRDYSNQPSSFEFKWNYPATYSLWSNVQELNTTTNSTNTRKNSIFQDQNISSPEFVFDLKNSFKTIKINDDFSIVTDILSSKNVEVDIERSIRRIDDYTKQFLDPIPNKKLLVLRKDYARNPIFGISQALAFLNPFPDDFTYETRFMKAYLASYLNELFIINKRKDHWITGGIQTYLMMKYVEVFFPDSKFLGDLYKFKFIGIRPFYNYSAAHLGYNESFSFIAEFGEHANNQQEDILGKESLTKINESYYIPYHVGSGLYYLDQYLGDITLENSIKKFSNTRGKIPLKTILTKNTDKKIDWFFDTYLSDREAYDLSIKEVLKGQKNIRITISEQNSKPVPFKLDLIKNDQIISEKWMHYSGKDTIVNLNSEDADFVAINSNRFLPEKNRPNNWKYLKSSSGFKPLQLTFYGDSENLKRNQLFYHPISDFNAYDGFTGGLRIYNTRVKNQPFEIDLHPQYSLKENSFVGFFRTRYRFINHNSKNYLNQVFLTGKSYHYNTNLRYTYIQPSFSMYFRPLDLRSNKRQLLNFSWFNVFRDKDPNVQVTPDYSVFNILHRYNNSDAVNVFATNSSFEASSKFGKIYFSSNYRKLFPSGRQFAIRFFAGKFLWHNTTETQYFDFNLNRSPDYLFRYDYLGRSESTGRLQPTICSCRRRIQSIF
jgi:hypothetical protein